MKQNKNLKSTILAVALSLGVGSIASAQQATTSAPVAPQTASTTDSGTGLLGSRYLGAGYDYLAISNSSGGPNRADGLEVVYNQPITANLDLGADYSWLRARFAGVRETQQTAELNAVGYTSLDWGKPFALASAGWAWSRAAGTNDDSFLYKVGVGVELPVVKAFSVSPYVDFARATGWNQSEVDFGVKAEYRVTKQVGVYGRVQYDSVVHSDNATEFGAGVNYHF